jgi:hypothetical protein
MKAVQWVKEVRLLVSEFRKIAVLILSLRKSNKSEKPSQPATN